MRRSIHGIISSAGEAVFHPTDLASLVAYCETPIAGASDGDLIASWNDDSGNSHPIVSSGSARGTYETNEINGNDVLKHVRANGDYSWISDHADLDVNHFTMFGVVRADAWHVSGSVLCMKAHPSSWVSGYGIAEYSGLLYAFASAYNVGAVSIARPTAGTPFAFALRYDEINVDLWINGVSVASIAYSTATPTDVYDLQFGNVTYSSDTSWGGFGLCNTGLNDTQMGQVFTYLMNKFGI